MNYQPSTFENLKFLDPDRAFLSLFVPVGQRQAVQILDLWNGEISRIREEVRELHMGLIRLQWWRDEIRRICKGGWSDAHPVLSLLSDVIPDYQLAFDDFDKILSARELEYMGRAPESFDELLSYIDGTQGTLMKMKAGILHGVQNDGDELSRFYSLVGLVRAIPFQASFGHVMMPNLNLSDIKPYSEKLRKYIENLFSELPHRTLSRGERAFKYFSAMQALAQLYLKSIERAAYDPFHIRPVAFKELRVWLKAF